jgi:hypothetical protein
VWAAVVLIPDALALRRIDERIREPLREAALTFDTLPVHEVEELRLRRGLGALFDSARRFGETREHVGTLERVLKVALIVNLRPVLFRLI